MGILGVDVSMLALNCTDVLWNEGVDIDGVVMTSSSLVTVSVTLCHLIVSRYHSRYYLKAQQLAPKDGTPYSRLAIIAINAVSLPVGLNL